MIGEPDSEKTPEVSASQDALGRSQEMLSDERLARGRAFIGRY
jgi:hypothetical protein